MYSIAISKLSFNLFVNLLQLERSLVVQFRYEQVDLCVNCVKDVADDAQQLVLVLVVKDRGDALKYALSDEELLDCCLEFINAAFLHHVNCAAESRPELCLRIQHVLDAEPFFDEIILVLNDRNGIGHRCGKCGGSTELVSAQNKLSKALFKFRVLALTFHF